MGDETISGVVRPDVFRVCGVGLCDDSRTGERQDQGQKRDHNRSGSGSSSCSVGTGICIADVARMEIGEDTGPDRKRPFSRRSRADGGPRGDPHLADVSGCAAAVCSWKEGGAPLRVQRGRQDRDNAPDRETGEKNFMTHYGNQDLYQGTVGLNWRAIWNKSGYSNTSLAFTSNKYNEDWYETTTGNFDIKNRSNEQAFKLRNVNHFRLNKKHTFEFGIEAKHLNEDYNNWYAETTNALGDTIPALTLQNDISANKIGAFVNYIAKPFNRLTTTWGIRTDYFSYTDNISVSPRFAFSYQLTSQASINGSFGLFHKNLP